MSRNYMLNRKYIYYFIRRHFLILWQISWLEDFLKTILIFKIFLEQF